MVEFAGYEMPVQYTSVIAEATAVRKEAGMFDVSHMARLQLTGTRVLEFLEHVTTNDVSKLENGRGQYSLLPNADGGVVDDIIVYRISETEYRMVVNAANHAKDVAWLKQNNTFGVDMVDWTAQTAMIAVQGPRAAAILAGMASDPAAIEAAPMFGFIDQTIAGISVWGARSGYTGEDGFELICSADDADRLWTELIAAGVLPCGLASRDTLRVEAGLPLYGHELNDEMSPLCAGLGWVISKTKNFIGSEHVVKARAEGVSQKIHGVRLSSKRLPMPGMAVMHEGKTVGEVTSGVYSPVLECGIAFVLVDASLALGSNVELDVRGKAEPGILVNKRFLKS